MGSFKETYIQVGSQSSLAISYFGLTVKSVSCPTFPDLKDLSKKSDPNTTGDVEFFPSTPYFKSTEMTLNLAYRGDERTGVLAITSFLDYIQGVYCGIIAYKIGNIVSYNGLNWSCLANCTGQSPQEGSYWTAVEVLYGSEFSIFDVYQNVGKRCRYESYGDDATYKCRDGIETITFSIKLKVNNPVTYGVFMPNGTIGAYITTDSKAYWSDGTEQNFVAGELIAKDLEAEDSFVIFEPTGGLRGITGFNGIPRVIVAGDNRIDTNSIIRFTTIK